MEKRLHKAVTSGDIKMLKMLQRDNTINILGEVTPNGNTALHLASYHGHAEVVKMLIEMINGNIEAATQASGGFLLETAYHGNAADVEKLIELMRPDIEAGIQTHVDFLRAKNKEGNTAFHEAAIGGSVEVMMVLLEHDHAHDLVNMINEAGETPLFKAVEGGNKMIVSKLLPLTSKHYDRRTLDGQTLLQCAVCKIDKGMLKKLIDAKPGLLEETDNSGRTPLHFAAYLDGISEVANIILERNKSLCYEVDSDGQSALHIAVKEGNLGLVMQILKYAKDSTEMVDRDGRNALHLAIKNAVHIFDQISIRFKDLVVLVLSKRLINNIDNEGKTALDIAMDNMHNDERLFSGIKRFLEKYGARRNLMVTREHSLTIRKSTWNVQMISVNAVLIATVAFAAAFTLPKENKNDKVNGAFFQLTAICIELAFCSSISSAVLLMYALHGKQEDPLLLDISLGGLWIALISLLLAFGAGMYVAVVKDHEMVAEFVLLPMVCIVPIFIRILILRSKNYIFREDESYLWILLILTSLQATIVADLWPFFQIYAIVMSGLSAYYVRRRYLQRKANISRDDWNYGWIFIWYLILGFIYYAPMWLILHFAWITVAIAAFIGQKLYFRSKQKRFTDDEGYIWVFAGGSIIGSTMNALFIVMHGKS